MGLHSLQAADTTDSTEADCRLHLIKEVPVLVASKPIFGYVYTNSAKTTAGTGRFRNAYRVTSPLIFNSSGPLHNVVYNSETGELIVSETGNYQITYHITVATAPDFDKLRPYPMALAVNGKEIRPTQIAIDENYSAPNLTGVFVLKLAKHDAVSLILPGKPPKSGFYLSRDSGGTSASLEVKKL
jgi:hypothetical protein